MKKQDFLIGCNYWASNAGCFMWKQFDEETVRKDLAFLAANGVNCIRIFPTWDDFQPIAENPIPKSNFFDSFSFRVRVNEKILNDQKFPNSGLSEEKLEQFKTLLDISKENDMKVIVAFITGWMSGRRFIPPLLQGKDVITDPTAIVWECRFIQDMIGEIKNYDNIIAWELGNECDCLSYEANEEQSEVWIMTIANAIRVADNSRPVYSGMAGTQLRGKFNQRILARHLDVLTTHPYPCFTPYCQTEDLHGFRSTLHAACETSYYASISGKPCMVEEIGTLGQSIMSDAYAAEYLERSLMTSLAVGTNGYLWWCAFEQDHLNFPPYDMNSLENYLGLAYADRQPKPVMRKMKEMREVLNGIGALPVPKADAVVILPHFVDTWKLAYGAFMLGVQAGRHIDFMYEEDNFKDSEYYVLPCVTLTNSIPHLQVRRLLKRVEDGAKLLITYNGGGVGEQERLTGMKIWGSEKSGLTKEFEINGKKLTIACANRLKLIADTAEVLIKDQEGEAVFTRNKVGKGEVYFFVAPLENAYTETYHAEDSALCEVYKLFFADKEKVFAVDSDKCMVTAHDLGSGKLAVMLNNFDERQELSIRIQDGYQLENIKYAEIVGDKIKMQRSFAYMELSRE